MHPCPCRSAGMPQPQKRVMQPAVRIPSYTMCMAGQVLHKSQNTQESIQTVRKLDEVKYPKQYLFLERMHLLGSCKTRSTSPGIYICTEIQEAFRHHAPPSSGNLVVRRDFAHPVLLHILLFRLTRRSINGDYPSPLFHTSETPSVPGLVLRDMDMMRGLERQTHEERLRKLVLISL